MIPEIKYAPYSTEKNVLIYFVMISVGISFGLVNHSTVRLHYAYRCRFNGNLRCKPFHVVMMRALFRAFQWCMHYFFRSNDVCIIYFAQMMYALFLSLKWCMHYFLRSNDVCKISCAPMKCALVRSINIFSDNIDWRIVYVFVRQSKLWRLPSKWMMRI